MSERYLDVAKESSLQEILSKIKEGSGLYINPATSTNNDYNLYEQGQLGTNEGTSVVNCKGTIYVIPDNSDVLKKYEPKKTAFIDVAKLPYKIDVHETSLVSFNNELHLLGGDDELLRSHYKWDGESWKIASELPFDFCDGLAIVYNNEIHIIGSSPIGFIVNPAESIPNFINSHYKWDGETWKKASNLPYITWGCTGFVMNSKLHICGGGRGDGVSYAKNHYIWDGVSWSRGTDLPDERFSASAVRISDTEVYITGGIDLAVNQKIASTIKYNGMIFSEGPSIETDGMVNSGYGVTYNNDRQPIIIGRRYYTLIDDEWKPSFSFGEFDNGAAIEVGDEIHVFNGINHYMFSSETKGEWVLLEPNNYPIHQTAILYSEGKIHIFGSSDDAYSDYHCTWDKENGWVNKANLPDKLINGTAVEYKGELHIIGGTEMNNKSFNHYKLFNNRWVSVGKTPYDIVGNRAAVVYNDAIYAIGYNDDPAKTYLIKFDDMGWSVVTSWETETDNMIPFTIIDRNRLHVLEYSVDSGSFNHKVFTITNDNKISSNYFDWQGYTVSPQSNEIPYVTNIMGWVGIIMRSKPTRGNMVLLGYMPDNSNTIEMWLPENHTFICDKSKFLPIIGNMEEVENGFKSLSTTKYTIAYMEDDEPYTIC